MRSLYGHGVCRHPGLWRSNLVDIVVDNCAICRNHIMDLCIQSDNEDKLRFKVSNVRRIKRVQQVTNVQLPGEFVMYFTRAKPLTDGLARISLSLYFQMVKDQTSLPVG